MWKQAVEATNTTSGFSRKERPFSKPRLKLNTPEYKSEVLIHMLTCSVIYYSLHKQTYVLLNYYLNGSIFGNVVVHRTLEQNKNGHVSFLRWKAQDAFSAIFPLHDCPISTRSRKSCEKRLLPSSYLSVCLSVRPYVHMEHLGSHWAYFHEIWYLRNFSKSIVEKILTTIWQE